MTVNNDDICLECGGMIDAAVTKVKKEIGDSQENQDNEAVTGTWECAGNINMLDFGMKQYLAEQADIEDACVAAEQDK